MANNELKNKPIDWYPGHIAKAKREIIKELKNVDFIIEILDARAPISTIVDYKDNSFNLKNKRVLFVLNKIDLADDKKVNKFSEYIKEKYENSYVISISSKDNIKPKIDKVVDKLASDIYEKNKNKGIEKTILKAMVIGMPNVGKSTFINSYLKRKMLKAENKPGVTKGLQWAKISDKIYMLDTPGITMPKFINDDAGMNLCILNSINDKLVEKENLIFYFIENNKSDYIDLFIKRYNLLGEYEVNKDTSTIDIYNNIALSKKNIKKGNNIDYEKTANMILTDFRNGNLGKMTIDNINIIEEDE